ncbi:ankyrin repeat domain-containing protein 54 [Cephus cinctus]|uniref:Ankyrin repeat domain-containing protein 54 n=1 Tax=Cephus cinctus TaxID=211228 RepID=A0AAJ7BVE1_CEPCN|nr:ankyrin repeat domain-containing protein 54 [Cephus cinctus]
MTSVDSGVETGNDSNDSLVAQHESLASNQIPGSSTTISTNSSGTSYAVNSQGQEQSSMSFEETPAKLSLLPGATIYPAIENSPTSSQISLPTSSSESILFRCIDARPDKLLEFRIPPMCNMTGLPMMGVFRAKTSSPAHWRRKESLIYRDFTGPLNERKMRLAAATNNIELMRHLLSIGVSPNNQDRRGRSPLHLASCRGYTEMVRLLLAYRADINQRDCLGNTPLHLAACTSKTSVVTLLLKGGTDVLSSDAFGCNPLQLAQSKLRMLQNCRGSDMKKVKDEVHNVVGMLLAYLQKQRDARDQVEVLSTFCSRLSLSNTSDEVQDDVRDLLANINSLSLTN